MGGAGQGCDLSLKPLLPGTTGEEKRREEGGKGRRKEGEEDKKSEGRKEGSIYLSIRIYVCV